MNKNCFCNEIDNVITDLDNMYRILRDRIIDDLRNEMVINELEYIDKLMDYIKDSKNCKENEYLEKLLVLQRCFYYLQIYSNLYNDFIFNRIMFIIQMVYNNLR